MTQISLRGYNLHIEDLLENDQIDEVIAHCRHIMQEYPRHLDTLRTLGKASLDSGNIDTSVEAFERVLESLPTDFVSNLGLSFINQSQGDIPKAIWYLERVFESNPSNISVQDELKKLITTRDGKTPDRLNKTPAILAQIYANAGEYVRAIEEITTIIADDPRRADMKTLLANIYYDMNDSRRALEACEDCFKDSAYNMEALRVAIKISEKSGADEKAAEWQTHLLELDPYAIDPETKFLVEDKELPDDVVSLDKLEWVPGNPEPPAAEGLGDSAEPNGADLDLGETQANSISEPVEEIPVEQDTPQWLKDLLNEARETTSDKFDRDAGDTIPDWVKDLEPDPAPSVDPVDRGLIPQAPAIAALEPEAIEEQAPPAGEILDEMDDWKPIPVEREDPMLTLAATMKSPIGSWYNPDEPVAEVEPAVVEAENAEVLASLERTQPNAALLAPKPAEEEAPEDWRDDLDLDWLGEPREEEHELEQTGPQRAILAEDEEEAPAMVETVLDAGDLDWLGDLSKPTHSDEPTWLGDVSQPEVKVEDQPNEGMAREMTPLPDAPNVMLPEGNFLPKEPIEEIPVSAIEEAADPARAGLLAGELISTENDDLDPAIEPMDDSGGDDFYASLQNPPSKGDYAARGIDEEQRLIGNVGAGSNGENYEEPIEEIPAGPADEEGMANPQKIEPWAPISLEDESSAAVDEPVEEIVSEAAEAEAVIDDEVIPAEEPIEEIVSEVTDVEAVVHDEVIPAEEPIEEIVPEVPDVEAVEEEVTPVEEPVDEIVSEVTDVDAETVAVETIEPQEDPDRPSEPDQAFEVEGELIDLPTEDQEQEERFIGSSFERGKRYLEDGNLDKALAEFSDLIKYERMIDEILPIMRQVVVDNPNNKRAMRVLGDAYFNADMLDEALSTYATADDLPEADDSDELI